MSDENLKSGLKSLIEQTYLIEQEYKNLRLSYENLQKIVKDVVDVLPTAVWVLNSDESLFLQNAYAFKSSGLFAILDLQKNEYEIEHDGLYYLIKIAIKDDKKIVQAIDVSSEKRTERLASMGQIAAHLAHEIRNPIGSVSILASMLLKNASEKNIPIVKEMQSAIWRVERIIKATLLFTKGVCVNSEVFNFLELKKECEDSLKYYTYSKNITITLDFKSAFYNADKDLLCIVFQNLLFNAIDAIEEDESESGDIKLWYKKEDKEHKFYIYDSGVSIDDKCIVFEPFKTSKLKGNGLGLSLCLEIIQAHNGSMEVSIEPKTFCVSLPVLKSIDE